MNFQVPTTMNIIRPLLHAAALLAVGQFVSAAVPSAINYQGRLTNAAGVPQPGSHTMNLKVYDAASAGTQLYAESIGNVTADANGVYSFQFGATGTREVLIAETIGTTDGSTTAYQKTLSNTPVIPGSASVTDGTYNWNELAGNPGAPASATATVMYGFVVGASVTNGGSGYISPPVVTISGNGTGATATATVSSGSVTGINIISAGSGYTTGATITIAPPPTPFLVNYSNGDIAATYETPPPAGRTITATYRYLANGISGALAASSELWLELTIDGVVQTPRQKILAVPFAMNAETAHIANTVSDGAITASKLSSSAITESIGNSGHLALASIRSRPDLLTQGFVELPFSPLSGTLLKETQLTARYGHTAVWTGTELIVWGGVGAALYSDGARYNPNSGVWTSMSTSPLDGRYEHTAVWTGTEMIVWGGVGGTRFSNGARYNPRTNTWTSLSASPLASRSEHTAVWTGTEMIIWGGQNGFTSFKNGARYNPATDSWSSFNDPDLVGRYGHTAIWTGTDMIIWGGYDGNSIYYNNGSRYNPSTNSWTPLNTTNLAGRTTHTSVWTGSEMIVWGGCNGSGDLADGARYRPSSDTWSSMNDSSLGRRRAHTAIWTGSDMIVFGGVSGNYNNDGARYRPDTNSWSSVGVSPIGGRYDHVAVWTGSDMIVWGGYGTKIYNDGARFFSLFFYAKP